MSDDIRGLIEDWVPLFPSFYWTCKILLCRSANSSACLYDHFLNSVNKVERPAACCLRFVAPDPQNQILAEDPHSTLHLCASYLLGVLFIPSDLESEEVLSTVQAECQAFYKSLNARGIKKAFVVCTQTSGWSEGATDRRVKLRTFLDGNGIQSHCVAIEASELGSSSSIGSLWVKRVVNLIGAMVEDLLRSGGSLTDKLVGYGGTLSKIEEAGKSYSSGELVRKREARLKKQEADCQLLLGRPIEGLLLALSAHEVFKAVADGPGQASCSELAGACMMRWGELEALDTTSPSSGNLPAALETAVRDTLLPKKGGSGTFLQMLERSSGVGTALQDLVNFEPSILPAERGRRRASMTASGTGMLNLAAASRFKDAASLYARAGATWPALTGAFVLGSACGEAAAAAEAIHVVVEELFFPATPGQSSAETAMLGLAAAAVYQALGLQRKCSYLVHLTGGRFAEPAGMPTALVRSMFLASVQTVGALKVPSGLAPRALVAAQTLSEVEEERGLAFLFLYLRSVQIRSKVILANQPNPSQAFLNHHNHGAQASQVRISPAALKGWPALQVNSA